MRNGENMENKVTHRWICMNCGEMTDSDICVNCGKESCTNTNEDCFKKSKHIEEFSKTGTEKEQSFLNEALNKSLKLAVFAINSSNRDESKNNRKLLSVFSAIIISFIFITLVLCLNTKIQIRNLTKMNNDLKGVVNSQSEKIDTLQKELKNNNNIKYVIHTVKAGETLETICGSYNINYVANRNIILSFNGIENPNQLAIGQILILPEIDDCN